MVSEREYELLLKRMDSLEAAMHNLEIAVAKQTGFNSMLPWIGTIVVGLAALGAYLLK